MLPIDVVSFRDDDGLTVALEIDPPLRMSDISSSRPVTLTEITSSGHSQRQLLQIKGIPGEARTRFFVRSSPGANKTLIVVRNAREAKLLVDRDYSIKTKIKSITEGLPIQVATFFLLSFAASLLVDRLFLAPLRESLAKSVAETRSLKERASELDEKRSQMQCEMASIKNDIQLEQTKNMQARLGMKCLLTARISDLRKELDFWRDTLRSYIVRNGARMDESDQLIRLISNKLHTWSTLSREQDPDSVLVAAELLERGSSRAENS